jgi:hypothetical protein
VVDHELLTPMARTWPSAKKMLASWAATNELTDQHNADTRRT